MIPDIIERFPKDENGVQYATLTKAEVSIAVMDEKSITSQIKISGDVTPDFSTQEWEVIYKDELYINPTHKPQGAKENTSRKATIDLTFQHWAIYQLKRYFFCTIADTETGIIMPDKYNASVYLNLPSFIEMFKQVLEYYYGDAITIDYNKEWVAKSEPTSVSIDHSKIWEVLKQLYDLYAVRWEIVRGSDEKHYIIRIGYPSKEVNHIFKYGFEGGLLKVERQVQSEEIANVLIGRGSEENLPKRYFKDIDPNNPDFAADPDWIPELADIYFDRLRGATFRSYVQGWKTKHYGDADYVAPKEQAYSQWAWQKGFDDEKFEPIEYVADEICDNASIDTKKIEITPGFTADVKKGSSIDEYGVLFNGLEDNDDIKPTLQDTGLDMIVTIEQIEDESEVKKPTWDGRINSLPAENVSVSDFKRQGERKSVTTKRLGFIVPEGRTANLVISPILVGTYKDNYIIESYDVIVYTDASGSKAIPASGIPSGTYYYEVKLTVQCTIFEDKKTSVGIQFSDPHMESATLQKVGEEGTFKIWVQNIWGTEIGENETPTAYAERVWKPILGDKEGNEAAVVFTTGNLAVSEDYEFKIVGYPEYDDNQYLYDGDDNEYQSHWCITLARSDADYETLGVYVPNAKRNGNIGDKIVFIGIEMTHKPYVVDAEKRLDDYKKEQLKEKSDIKPTWVVSTDRVRLNEEGREDALINQISVGAQITLEDERFIGGSNQEILFIQALKYTYREASNNDTALNPDLEMTIGTEFASSSNSVSTLSGEVSAIRHQLNSSLSNIEQVVRTIGDKTYLRKDRSDRTPYPLRVGGELISEKEARSQAFASGQTGYGWKIDKGGNIEADALTLRRFLEVPELRYNRTEVICGTQWRAPGGGKIASVEIKNATTGRCTLKLEDGEIGAVSVGDLCMGVFHMLNSQGFDADSNAREDSDDRRGNFKYSGFTTIYFEITSVAADNSYFDYKLRANTTAHPQTAMSFVGYGNRTNIDRQKSYYATRTYERYLSGVSDWEFSEQNIMMQLGDLSGLTIGGEDMSGYSAYLNNVYFRGVLRKMRDNVSDVANNLLNETYDFGASWRKRDGVEIVTNANNFSEVYQDNSEGTSTAVMTYQNFPFKADTTYTLSFWAKGSGKLITYCYSNTWGTIQSQLIKTTGTKGGTTSGDTNNEYALNGEWTRHYLVFKVLKNDTSINSYVQFATSAGCIASIKAIKLEEGEAIESDWTPSPKDMLGEKGEKGDKGDNAINIELSPATTILKKGARSHNYIYVDLFDGGKQIDYYNSTSNPDGFLCSTLANTSTIEEGLDWRFYIDNDNRFMYDLVYYGETDVDIEIPFTVTYKGVEYKRKLIAKSVADGAQGAVMRVCGAFDASHGDYSDGTTADAEGTRWIDLIWIDGANNTRYYFTCKKSLGSGTNKPTTASNDNWELMSDLGSIYADLVFAKNARIDFLASQEIVFGETASNGTTSICGRIGSPTTTSLKDIIMWLGGANPTNATMTFDKLGNARFGLLNGKRVELDPNEKEVRVYNDSGELAITIDGDTHDIADLYKTTDRLTKTYADSSVYSGAQQVSNSKTVNLGTLILGEKGHITINALLYGYAQARYFSATTTSGTATILASTSRIRIAIYDKSEYESNPQETTAVAEIVHEVEGDKNYFITNPPSSTTTTSGTAKTQTDEQQYTLDTDLEAGDYVVIATYYLSKPKYPSITNYCAANARIKDYKCSLLVGSSPRALLSANGLIVANSTQDFLTAGIKGSEGFVIEGHVGEVGLKIDKEGIKALDVTTNTYRKIAFTFEE